MINKDEAAGKAEQLKGRLKQGVGDMTNDPELVDEGLADEASGEVRENVGTAKRKVADATRKVADAIEK